jgi:hypothetical protein
MECSKLECSKLECSKLDSVYCIASTAETLRGESSPTSVRDV